MQSIRTKSGEVLQRFKSVGVEVWGSFNAQDYNPASVISAQSHSILDGKALGPLPPALLQCLTMCYGVGYLAVYSSHRDMADELRRVERHQHLLRNAERPVNPWQPRNACARCWFQLRQRIMVVSSTPSAWIFLVALGLMVGICGYLIDEVSNAMLEARSLAIAGQAGFVRYLIWVPWSVGFGIMAAAMGHLIASNAEGSGKAEGWCAPAPQSVHSDTACRDTTNEKLLIRDPVGLLLVLERVRRQSNWCGVVLRRWFKCGEGGKYSMRCYGWHWLQASLSCLAGSLCACCLHPCFEAMAFSIVSGHPQQPAVAAPNDCSRCVAVALQVAPPHLSVLCCQMQLLLLELQQCWGHRLAVCCFPLKSLPLTTWSGMPWCSQDVGPRGCCYGSQYLAQQFMARVYLCRVLRVHF